MKVSKIYLSGAIEDSSDPGRWREDIKMANTTDSLSFIDPLEFDGDEVVKCRKAIVKEADGVLVHYEEECESWQPAMEMFMAYVKDKPVVVWTGQFQNPKEQLDDWLLEHTDAVHKNGRDALNKLLKLL